MQEDELSRKSRNRDGNGLPNPKKKVNKEARNAHLSY
jgi:hypothetical protein